MRFGAPVSVLAVLALAGPVRVDAQQSPALAEGVDHYWNGRYEDALAALSEEKVAGLPADEQREALQYQAFSLVALERNTEAVDAFIRLLELDPDVELDRNLVSPKILARFGAARGAAVMRQVEEGRARYEAGEYESALESFEAALALDPGHGLAAEYRLLCRARMELAEVAASATSPAPEPSAEPADPDRVYTLSGEITEPALVRRVEPEYPRLDRVRGSGGTVVLLVVVDREGEVEVDRVLRSVNSRLDAAATRAVRRWRYRPARLGVSPVSVYKVVTLKFVP